MLLVITSMYSDGMCAALHRPYLSSAPACLINARPTLLFALYRQPVLHRDGKPRWRDEPQGAPGGGGLAPGEHGASARGLGWPEGSDTVRQAQY